MNGTEAYRVAADGLTDAVALLWTQSRMGEGLPQLQETVRDIRARLAQLLHDAVAIATPEALLAFRADLRAGLERHGTTCLNGAEPSLKEHFDYCLREILVCLELAGQICAQHPATETRRRLLADLPILRPFEYPPGALNYADDASAESTATVTISS
ncbi:MAG: hypothetical protein HYV03_01245 [Deltaproteobacteria bacterium]|nr:hypothetical protein [Deltaproteobacteria bacterium]